MGPDILSDLARHAWVYASMPLIAAAIGYVTKLLAIEMMFRPVEPVLGWQGIVPRHAERMARIACRTITAKLLSPRDVFARIDAARLVEEIRGPLLIDVEAIAHDVMSEYHPGVWNNLPRAVRRTILARIKAEAPETLRVVIEDVKANLDSVFDLEAMVTTSLVQRRELLNRIFEESGREEFRFIRRSGIWFGAAIGLVQVAAWLLTRSPLVMPLFGLLTGWLTDWLALKMLFYPKTPRTFLGWTWQGLFLRRRREVAAAYGELIAAELITPRNVMQAVLAGPLSDRLFAMVQEHVQRLLDEQTGPVRPLVLFTIGSEGYLQMKRAVTRRALERLPVTLRRAEAYAAQAMDVRTTLVRKLQELTPEEFEGILRPAFRQDEWKLIAVGAILGFLVGELQVLLVLH